MKFSQADIDRLVAQGAILGPVARLPTETPPEGRKSKGGPLLAIPASPTALASLIDAYCKAKGVEKPDTEYEFAKPERKWRFDFCWADRMVALEYEGIGGGRHQRHRGFIADSEKYSEAAVRGWCVIRVTAKTLDKLWPWLDRVFDKEKT